MQTIEFAPIGRRTSRIGLGCARLVGRSSLRQSARLVETALDLGIRYFDVAPSYGMGTAEEVLGQVLGDSKEVVVATKIGVPRPPYSARANQVRRIANTILSRVAPLQRLARRAYGGTPTGARPRYDFSSAAMRASLEESLQKLKRTSVDVFLAHEPAPEDLDEGLTARFRSLQQEGLITAFGVGIGAIADRWKRMGSIWQSRWPGPTARAYVPDVEHIWHGVIRSAIESGGQPARRPAEILTAVLGQSPRSIVLVSTSSPGRLQQLVAELTD